MKVERVDILVEEPSMELVLRAIVPKIVDLDFDVYQHDSKPELFARLPERLAGYAAWLPESWRILVIVDRDDDDCVQLRRELDAIATRAGLSADARTVPARRVVNRIAIEELEAWFFGDWEAVRLAYPRVAANVPAKQAYRDPDGIKGGTWEALERELRKAGYFKTGLQKLRLAREIAAHMEPDRNRSPSFRKFRDALRALGAAS